MTKILDEVRYDIYRRVLAASVSPKEGSPLDKAEYWTAVAVERMRALGIIGEPKTELDLAKECTRLSQGVREWKDRAQSNYMERDRLSSIIKSRQDEIINLTAQLKRERDQSQYLEQELRRIVNGDRFR